MPHLSKKFVHLRRSSNFKVATQYCGLVEIRSELQMPSLQVSISSKRPFRARHRVSETGSRCAAMGPVGYLLRAERFRLSFLLELQRADGQALLLQHSAQCTGLTGLSSPRNKEASDCLRCMRSDVLMQS